MHLTTTHRSAHPTRPQWSNSGMLKQNI